MKAKFIYITLISLLTINSAFSQWVQTDGPYGTMRITSLFINNNKLYASSPCGLYSTLSPSAAWKPEASIDVQAYDINGNLVYFGGNNSGIQQLNLSDPTKNAVDFGLEGSSVISIKDGGTCLFASDGSFFFKTNGYNLPWERETRGLPYDKDTLPDGTFDYTFPVNSIETIDNWVYAATHQGVYKADINIMTWTKISNGLSNGNVQMLQKIDGNLYAGIVNDLFRSTDKGVSWSHLDESEAAISAVSKMGDQLYYSTFGSGVYTSSDDGLTWAPINTGPTDQFITTMIFMGNTLICGTNEQGVFYYDGISWTNISKGMICSDIWSMTTTTTSIIASDDNNVYSSTGNSNSWQTITPEVAKHYFGSVTSMGNMVFLSYKDNNDKQLIKYTNSNTWANSSSTPPFTSDDTYKMVTKGNTLYVYDNAYFYLTNNMGTTWEKVGDASENGTNFNDFIIFNNIRFAAKDGNAELFRLDDNNHWVSSNFGLPADKVVKNLAFSSDAVYAYVINDGIYVSRDNGSSWTKATNGYLPAFEIRSFASRDSSIFVSSDQGVLYSSDYGQNWHTMNEGIEELTVSSLVIYNDSLFAGTMGNGIWKHDLNDFIPAEEIDTTLKVQRIRIFPNPASEYVRFDFNDIDIDEAQIRILNILGSEMINQKLGSDRQIAVNRLVNGAYIIVITTGKFTFTSKLVIQR